MLRGRSHVQTTAHIPDSWTPRRLATKANGGPYSQQLDPKVLTMPPKKRQHISPTAQTPRSARWPPQMHVCFLHPRQLESQVCEREPQICERAVPNEYNPLLLKRKLHHTSPTELPMVGIARSQVICVCWDRLCRFGEASTAVFSVLLCFENNCKKYVFAAMQRSRGCDLPRRTYYRLRPC